jgi:hypothetical protein
MFDKKRQESYSLLKANSGVCCPIKVRSTIKMNGQTSHDKALIEKIRALPPERIAEVEDFVDFLRQRDEDRLLVRAASKLSENAFQNVWDNPDDAEYDRLPGLRD